MSYFSFVSLVIGSAKVACLDICSFNLWLDGLGFGSVLIRPKKCKLGLVWLDFGSVLVSSEMCMDIPTW